MKNELEGARREAGRFGCGRVRDGEAVRTRGRGHGEEEKDLRGAGESQGAAQRLDVGVQERPLWLE